MEEIQGAAERAVRDMLRTIYKSTDGKPLEAVDYMDDGTPIQLRVSIDESSGGAIFDFEGTGPEAYGEIPIIESHGDQIRNQVLTHVRQLERTDSDLPLRNYFRAPVHG